MTSIESHSTSGEEEEGRVKEGIEEGQRSIMSGSRSRKSGSVEYRMNAILCHVGKSYFRRGAELLDDCVTMSSFSGNNARYRN